MDQDKLKRMQEKQMANRQKSYERHLNRQKATDHLWRMRDFLNEIRISNRSSSHIGCFRGSPGAESDEHLDMKYQVWKQLKKWGHDVMTEVIFENGKRADVIDMTDGIIFEILHTETVQELQEKVKDYPEIFEVRHVRAGQEFREELLL